MDDPLDWTLLRSFLTVAETGSLSAAARQLRLSQPTLGRHIQDIEAQLGTALFTRALRGMVPTQAGLALVPAARDMRDAARRLALVAAGQGEGMTGTVRLTASRIVSQFLLPPMLAQLRQDEPGIEIELVPSDTSENLLFREADIALRMYRPTQLDVVTRHLADMPVGLYGTPALLDRIGRPQTRAELLGCEFVGFDRNDLILRTFAAMGFPKTREDFRLRCDDQVVYWALVRAGCGIGAMQRLVGDADAAVERIAGFVDLPALPVWLTAPEALRQNPRIRRVLDHLSDGFRSLTVHAQP